MVEISLKHDKRIGISPEFTLWIKTVIELPIDSNILTSVVGTDWKLVNENFKFYEFVEVFWRESDFCNGLLLGSSVVKYERVLV